MFKKVFAGISALAICAMSMPAAALTSFADADLHDINMNIGTVSTTGAIVDGKLAESEKVVLDITIDKNEGFHAMSAFFDIQQPEGASVSDGSAILFTAINARNSEFGASNAAASGSFTTNSWKDGGDNSKYNPSFVYNTGLSGADANTYVTGLFAPSSFVVPAGTPEGAYRVGFATNADGTLNIVGSVTDGSKEVGANITYTAGYIIVGNADIPDDTETTTTSAAADTTTTASQATTPADTTLAPTTSATAATSKNPDATDGFEIEIGTVEVEAGAKEAVVPVTIKKNPGLQALTMGLDYNTSDIQLQKFELTEDFLYTEDGETFGELTKDEKTGYLVWQKADGLETDMTGVIINLTFAITDAKAGDKYPIGGIEAMASKGDHETRIIPKVIDGAIIVKDSQDVTDGFEIEIGTVHVPAGTKEAVVPVTINKNPGLQALTMGLDYDSSDIQLQKFELTEDFLYTEDGETFGELTKDEKTGYLVWQKADGLETDMTGVIINLTFAITDAQPGDEYPINGIEAMASKGDHETRIIPTVINGAIIVDPEDTTEATTTSEPAATTTEPVATTTSEPAVTTTPEPTTTTVITTTVTEDSDVDFSNTTSGNQGGVTDSDGTTEDPNNHKVHRRLGDVDNNDEVTSYDALLILQNVVQVKDFNYVDNAVADVADMNQGDITSYDALKVLQLVVEVIENFDGATFVDVTLDENEVEVPDTRVYYDADNNPLNPNLEYTIRQQ